MFIVTYSFDGTVSNYSQGLNEDSKAVALYKGVLRQDNMCIEAIACIATHYFYNDQPEIALKFYRSVFSQVDL